MTVPKTLLLGLVLSLCLLFLPAHASGRYTPHQGDYFNYHEVVDLNGGTGDYQGYTEHTAVDGTERMNTVYGNGTVGAHWSYTYSWSNSSGSYKSESPSGDFTYSSTDFHYVRGTDNQTGYSNPFVWFYINNSTQNGGTFYLLNTAMTVTSTDYNYRIPAQDRRVYAISSEGSSSYQRNDVYGRFSATYTWTAYFDRLTGYIIGYEYTEHDINGFAGFTYTETLSVSQTSYQLTPAPPTLSDYAGYIVTAFIAIIIAIVVAVVAITIRNRKRAHPLPEHPTHQQPIGTVNYSSPPPPPYSPPPSQQGIDLTPRQQPPVQQIVIKEVVKVKCRYCGALIDSTVQLCPYCGAPRT